jgi:hypothetical protein
MLSIGDVDAAFLVLPQHLKLTREMGQTVNSAIRKRFQTLTIAHVIQLIDRLVESFEKGYPQLNLVGIVDL